MASADAQDRQGDVRFGVLGPLEVQLDGADVGLRGHQERTVLALLLTAPGHVFPVSALVDALWGSAAPAAADRTAQSYVSRLRRALPPPVGGLVRTRSPGYVAVVEPDRVDAELFRSSSAAGRQALARGDAGRAGPALRAALALWRGEPYAGLDAPALVAERQSLEQLRLSALEDCFAAELALGAGAALVAELEPLVAQHPLRERLWCCLMTALYRSGRQGEALHAYRRARSTLVDELGVEPGPELRALEAAVLAHDPDLRALVPRPSDRPPAVVTPAFLGRDDQLALLVAAVERGSGAVLVTGRHGIGKTRLLTELAGAAHARGAVVLGRDDPVPRDRSAVRLVDDLHRLAPPDLVAALRPPHGPVVTVAACVWDALPEDVPPALGRTFGERLELPALSDDDVEVLVRLYVPARFVPEALRTAAVRAAQGVPLHVHAAASRFAEDLVTRRLDAAAGAVPVPQQRLQATREQVVQGVEDLQRLHSAQELHSTAFPVGDVCPFKGLASFDVEDAPYFAGREQLAARSVARLVESPAVTFVGASGSGKSSLVRAGLVAAVRRGALPGSRSWCVVVTTPSRPPPALPPDGARLLLVVDQLEEVFTALLPPQQAAYATWLADAADRDGTTVVVTIRSDYFGRLAEHPRLAEHLSADTVLVGAMTADELRRAVELPAAAAGLDVEPGLADAVVREVVGQPGSLPLLSTALLSVWERREGRRLTLAAYREVGGVRTAVARLAESAYARLDPQEQVRCRRVLLRLAETGERGRPVRRRAPRDEVAPPGDVAAQRVLDVLAARRLVSVSATHVEVSHEALLREWPRLARWLEEDEAGRALRRHLAPAAVQHRTTGDPGELYRGARLVAAREWHAVHPGELTALERDFVEASEAADEADRLRRQRSVRRLRLLAAGLAAVLVVALGAGWVAQQQRDRAGQAALSADVRALRAAALDEQRWDLALLYAAQAFRLEPSSSARAALLQTVQRSPEATAVLTTARGVHGLALSSDGGRLAGVTDETVVLWDVRTRALTSLPGLLAGPRPSVDLSEDGRRLLVAALPPVVAGERRTVFDAKPLVVDLAAGALPPRSLGGSPVTSAAFGPAGDVVALGADGRVRVLDGSSGGVLRTLLTDGTPSPDARLGLTRDRRRAVVADSYAAGPVTVLDLATGRVLWREQAPGAAVAALSEDGAALLVGHADGRLEHVALPSGVRSTLSTPTGVGLRAVGWAPDGTAFAAATGDGSVLVWDAPGLQRSHVLLGHSGAVTALAWSADGTVLHAAGLDRSVLTWDLSGGRGTAAAQSASEDTLGSLVTQDGSLAATYHASGRLQLFDLADGTEAFVDVPQRWSPVSSFTDARGRWVGLVETGWNEEVRENVVGVRLVDTRRRALLPRPFQLEPDLAYDAVLDAAGDVLLTAEGRRLRAFDVLSGQPLQGVDHTAQDRITSIAEGSDGRLVALDLDESGVEVADLSTGERVASLDPEPDDDAVRRANPLLFSPDGRWLAGGTSSGRVVVWDTTTWRLRDSWVAVKVGEVQSLAFTPDSRSLVVGGGDRASLWDVGQGAVTGASWDAEPLLDGGVVDVGTADSGRTVVTMTEGGGVREWAVGSAGLLTQACRVVGRDLTQEEWDAVLPERPYERTCTGR